MVSYGLGRGQHRKLTEEALDKALARIVELEARVAELSEENAQLTAFVKEVSILLPHTELPKLPKI